MYDEMTNQDFICALAEKAHPADNPSAEHAAMMDEAARRIRKLENTVIAATAAIESIEDAAYSVQDWSGTYLGETLDEARKAVGLPFYG